MQFAQKVVKLEGGNARAFRGALHAADIGEYADAVRDSWDAAFVQLGPGHLNAGIEFLAGDRFVLYRESWEQRLHTVGTVRPGMIAFGIPAANRADAHWWGRPMPQRVIPFERADGELDLVTGVGDAITVLLMEEKDFFEFFHRTTCLDPSVLLRNPRFMAVRQEAIATLRTYWDHLLATSQQRESCAFGFADVVGALIDALELGSRAFLQRTGKADVVAAVLHEAQKSGYEASVPELSLRLRISRRTIEYAFQEHLGVSPRAYFALRRLDLCRHELIEGDPQSTTVTAIATNHGFYELGRFSSTYRQQFGELPSESLRKSSDHVTVGVAPTGRNHRPSAVRFPERSEGLVFELDRPAPR